MKHNIKISRAVELYNGFKGAQTIDAVVAGVPEELIERLTAKELSVVMQAVNSAYHRGRKSTGAEMIDNNAVYIDKIDKVIEWKEEGAEYESKTMVESWGKHTVAEKVKDGVLIPFFSE